MELDIPIYQEGDQHCPAGQEGKPTAGMYAKVCGRYKDRKRLMVIFNKVKGQGGKAISLFGPDERRFERRPVLQGLDREPSSGECFPARVSR